MDAEVEIERLLKEHGGVLTRTKKHRVWKFPDGRTYVRPATAGDINAAKNSLSDLRNLLGVKRESNKNPARKQKQGTVDQFRKTAATPKQMTLKDKLAAALDAPIPAPPKPVAKKEPEVIPEPVIEVPAAAVKPAKRTWRDLRPILQARRKARTEEIRKHAQGSVFVRYVRGRKKRSESLVAGD